ncbi:MAG: folate-binding protein [Flaviflexus sp.]|nr:folate-binding protein [Flaviflexus sp.]
MAVMGEGIDAKVPAHYGSPHREQRALMEKGALVDLSQFEVVTVAGPDRLSWLHNLTSQHLTGLTAGESTELLILDVNGRIDNAAAVVDDGDRLFLIVDSGYGDKLVTFLQSMKFMLRVDVELTDLAVIGSMNAPSFDSLAVWRDPWPEIGPESVAYGPKENHPGEGHHRFLAVVEADRAPKILEAAERLAGMLAWEAQRIVDLRPRLGVDVDERSLPHEWDWLRTSVHLDKGCYRGQEAVARIVNLGRPPRRAVFIDLDGSVDELPAPGTPIQVGEKQVGTLTSVGRDMDEGPVGLGLVKRNAPVDAEALIGSVAARLHTIVTPDGKTERSYERPKLR